MGLDVPSKHISGSCSAYRSLHTGTHVINYKKTFTSPSFHCHASPHPSLPLTSPHPYFPSPSPLTSPSSLTLTYSRPSLPLITPRPHLHLYPPSLLPLPLTFTLTSPHFSPSPSPSPLPPFTSPPHLTSPHPSPILLVQCYHLNLLVVWETEHPPHFRHTGCEGTTGEEGSVCVRREVCMCVCVRVQPT